MMAKKKAARAGSEESSYQAEKSHQRISSDKLREYAADLRRMADELDEYGDNLDTTGAREIKCFAKGIVNAIAAAQGWIEDQCQAGFKRAMKERGIHVTIRIRDDIENSK